MRLPAPRPARRLPRTPSRRRQGRLRLRYRLRRLVGWLAGALAEWVGQDNASRDHDTMPIAAATVTLGTARARHMNTPTTLRRLAGRVCLRTWLAGWLAGWLDGRPCAPGRLAVPICNAYLGGAPAFADAGKARFAVHLHYVPSAARTSRSLRSRCVAYDAVQRAAKTWRSIRSWTWQRSFEASTMHVVPVRRPAGQAPPFEGHVDVTVSRRYSAGRSGPRPRRHLETRISHPSATASSAPVPCYV
ncbi:hypothetical protein DAEQUDRAFT_345918 [Daedalea quercina L-15889]|uniref:Uncharacterized protein n=1 Tax=Daedalea quercina L-15889 TaxID=1314783 RepID=A0A165PBX3_9APHY|nr:hypothetical protein DAEQUDRAFT_345918 [Daedalea quercina L-15889]